MGNNMLQVIEILLVEDNDADIRLTKEAFKEGKVCNNLYVVKDGEEAMAFLKKEGEYAASPTPDLILLDLNLPGKNGREVLKEIKEDSILKKIPVVILTSSKIEGDIAWTYEEHANCYIIKPVDLDQFITIVQAIEDFWFAAVKLPSCKGRNG